MGKATILLIAVLLATSLFTLQHDAVKAESHSTAPSNVWQHEYGNSNIEVDRISNLVQTKDDGYAFLSLDWNHQFTTLPAVLFKVDSVGSQQWNKTIESFGAYSLAKTADDGFAVLGVWNWDPNSNSPRANALIQINSQGNIQWSRNYSIANPNLNTPICIIESSDGGFALLFQTGSYQEDHYQTSALVIKTDPEGNIDWQKSYDAKGNYSNVNNLIQTRDGGYAIVGSNSYNGITDTPNLYYWLLKTDVNGNLEWNTSYGNGPNTVEPNQTRNWGATEGTNRGTYGDNEALSVTETAGGFVVAGTVYSESNAVYWENYRKTLLVKTDNTGNMLWNKTLDGYEISPIIETSDQGLIYGSSDGIVKMDTYGIVEWVKTDTAYSTIWSNHQRLGITSIIETSDGGIAMLGAAAINDNIWDGNIYLFKAEAFLPQPTPAPTVLIPRAATSDNPILPITLAVSIIIIFAIAIVLFSKRKSQLHKLDIGAEK